MKRQADGVSSESNEQQQTEINGNKRIRLLNNEEDNGDDLQMDGVEGKIMMDVSLNENSHNHNHEDFSTGSHSDVTIEKDDTKNASIQNENESTENKDSLNYKANNSCNGEDVTKVTENNSGIDSELHNSKPHENSATYSEENPLPDDPDLEPPVLNHCDHDLHNNESTDSFQSEGFTAVNYASESNNEIAEKKTSQEKKCDQEKESSFEVEVNKNYIDVANLTLSHLKVTELKGHSDVIFAVTADEDFILSASADTSVKVWNMERQNIVSTFSGHSNTVTSVLLLNPNQSKALKKKMSLTKVSRIAVTGSLDCHIKLWSVLEGKELASIYTFNGITCLGYLESECLVVVGTEGGKLELWNMSSEKAIISVHAHEDEVTDIKVQDNYIFTVSIDGTVKVWAYEEDDIYPVYTRKRKELSSDKTGFKPAHWKTVSVSDNIIYLGDDTNSIKVLDWRAGRLHLYKNQTEEQGVCDSVVAEKNMLFSAFYDSSSDAGGINVWKLPEMTYACTIAGDIPYINNLAAVQKDNKLIVICGGHKLYIFEFDVSRPPSSENEFFGIQELDSLGHEINEKSVEVKSSGENYKSNSSYSGENTSNNRWCSIM